MIGDKAEAPKDVRAYRRRMSARMIMDYDNEVDNIEEIVRGQMAIQGKTLTFDGVARNMPKSVKGVLRPRDAKRGGGLSISEEQLKRGLKSASYAMIVSNDGKRAMRPAGAAMDPGAPIGGGEGVAGGRGVAAGRGVGAGKGLASGHAIDPGRGVAVGKGAAGGKGVASGPGIGPEHLVTGGSGMQRALSPESKVRQNATRDHKSISSIKGMKKGGRIQKLLDAISVWFLQLSLVAAGVGKNQLPRPDLLEAVNMETLPELPWESADRCARLAEELATDLSMNVDEALSVDTFCLGVCERRN